MKIISIVLLLVTNLSFAQSNSDGSLASFEHFGFLNCSTKDGGILLRRIQTHLGESILVERINQRSLPNLNNKERPIDFSTQVIFQDPKLLTSETGETELGAIRTKRVYQVKVQILIENHFGKQYPMICEKIDLSDID